MTAMRVYRLRMSHVGAAAIINQDTWTFQRFVGITACPACGALPRTFRVPGFDGAAGIRHRPGCPEMQKTATARGSWN